VREASLFISMRLLGEAIDVIGSSRTGVSETVRRTAPT